MRCVPRRGNPWDEGKWIWSSCRDRCVTLGPAGRRSADLPVLVCRRSRSPGWAGSGLSCRTAPLTCLCSCSRSDPAKSPPSHPEQKHPTHTPRYVADLLILYSVTTFLTILVLLILSQIGHGMNSRPGEIQTQMDSSDSVSSHLTLKCSLSGKPLYMQINTYTRLRQIDTKKEILM